MADKDKKDSGKFREPIFDSKNMNAARDAIKKGDIKIKTDDINLKKKGK